MIRKINKPLSYYLGNFLIAISVFFLLFIYYPIIGLYLFPPKIDENLNRKGYYIQIPKIRAQAPIVTNVDPWNEKEYQTKLTQGVAHAKGTSIPNEQGSSFLFAHSSDLPWRISRYNTVFLRLPELKIGDDIYVFKNGKKTSYKVFAKKEVWPNEVKYLEKTSKNQLILQTCVPIGTAFKRLLIFAEPS